MSLESLKFRLQKYLFRVFGFCFFFEKIELFSMSVVKAHKTAKNTILFRSFYHYNPIWQQNKYHIRHQRTKLYRTTCFSAKCFFQEKRNCTPLQEFFSKS